MAEWRVYEADTPQCTSCGMWMPFARYRRGQGTDAKREIAEMPAADVAPVVHGKWVPPDGIPGFLVCSACEDCYVVAEWADEKKWMYCPACGAKMAKEEDND